MDLNNIIFIDIKKARKEQEIIFYCKLNIIYDKFMITHLMDNYKEKI